MKTCDHRIPYAEAEDLEEESVATAVGHAEAATTARTRGASEGAMHAALQAQTRKKKDDNKSL